MDNRHPVNTKQSSSRACVLSKQKTPDSMGRKNLREGIKAQLLLARVTEHSALHLWMAHSVSIYLSNTPHSQFPMSSIETQKCVNGVLESPVPVLGPWPIT